MSFYENFLIMKRDFVKLNGFEKFKVAISFFFSSFCFSKEIVFLRNLEIIFLLKSVKKDFVFHKRDKKIVSQFCWIGNDCD